MGPHQWGEDLLRRPAGDGEPAMGAGVAGRERLAEELGRLPVLLQSQIRRQKRLPIALDGGVRQPRMSRARRRMPRTRNPGLNVAADLL